MSSDMNRGAEDDDQQALELLISEQAEKRVRRVWHEGRWYFNVIDMIAVLTDSPNPRNYWNMLKRHLHDEGADETYTNCVQLKLRAADGKLRETDCASATPSPRRARESGGEDPNRAGGCER